MAVSKADLSPEELAEIKKDFDDIDADKDGKINLEDLKKLAAAENVQATDDQIKQLIAKADPSGGGVITYDAFIEAYVYVFNRWAARMEKRLRKLFKKLDIDNTGFLTADSLKRVVKEAGAEKYASDAEIDEAIKDASSSGDGKVSEEDFLNAFQKLFEEKQAAAGK